MPDDEVNSEKLREKATKVANKVLPPYTKNGKEVGKETQVGNEGEENPDYSTGDEYIDKGTSRVREDDFLSVGQRSRVVQTYKERMLEASSNFKSALTQVRVDQLIRDPDDMSWVLSLALAAIGAYGASIFAKAVSGVAEDSFLSGFLGQEGGLLPSEKTKRTRIIEAIHKRVNAAAPRLAKAVDSKAKIDSGAIVDERKWEAKIKNKENVDFLDVVQQQSGVWFQRTRETGMIGRSDAELLILYASWDVEANHSVGDYKDWLVQLLAQYKASQVKSVGRNENFNPFNAQGVDPGNAGHRSPTGTDYHRIDRFVVRLAFQSGAASQYAIADKYIADDEFKDGHKYPDAKGTDLKEGTSGGHAIQYTMKKYSLIEVVHPDLVQVAIARHKEQWHADPKTIIVNDEPRMKPQGPTSYGHDPKATGPKDPNVYNVEDTKGIDWNDPKTWKYDNEATKGYEHAHDR